MNYILHLLTYLGIYATLALSLNFIVGYCGRITLAHGAYFAVGAYCYAIVAMAFGPELAWSLPLAVVLGAGLSLLISLPATRFRGDQFVLISLVVHTVLYETMRNWGSQDSPPGTWTNLTNGTYGLTGIPRPSLLGLQLTSPLSLALLSLSFACLSGAVSWLLLSSPFGRLLKAARDDDLAARALGKNVRMTRIAAFAVSCSMASLAGAAYASYVRYVDPSLASLDESVLILSMLLVGGSGNRLTGPLTGAAFLLAVPELLRLLNVLGPMASSIQLLLYGAALVLILHLRPQGLAGEYGIR